nr:hypothetical protein [Tanacetum cinerariifolium]
MQRATVMKNEVVEFFNCWSLACINASCLKTSLVLKAHDCVTRFMRIGEKQRQVVYTGVPRMETGERDVIIGELFSGDLMSVKQEDESLTTSVVNWKKSSGELLYANVLDINMKTYQYFALKNESCPQDSWRYLFGGVMLDGGKDDRYWCVSFQLIILNDGSFSDRFVGFSDIGSVRRIGIPLVSLSDVRHEDQRLSLFFADNIELGIVCIDDGDEFG